MSSSVSTKSAAVPGRGRCRSARRCCLETGACTRCATRRRSPRPSARSSSSRIAAWCVTWAVGHASQAECDEIGMADAQRLAAQRAIEGLGVVPDAIVVDGKWDFVSRGADSEGAPHREGRCDVPLSVDSIGAREVTRDRMMPRRVPALSGLRLRREQGLPVPEHKAALAAWGPTSIHRRTWVFMDHLPWPGMRVLRPEQAQLFEV